MSKQVRFNIEDDIEENLDSKIPFGKKFKHTLDSDEEDDEVENDKKYELDVSNNIFDGEVEGNLRREEGILITPFNIKEELKEGHFDNQGMYIFREKNEEIKDNWLDNIDWVKIEDKVENTECEVESTQKNEIVVEDCYIKLLNLMLPNETVKKTIQRLGKSNLQNKVNKNKNRQKLKKQQFNVTSSNQIEEESRKLNLNNLIELSDKLLSTGDIDIYEKSYETIKNNVEKYEKQKASQTDMFADDL